MADEATETVTRHDATATPTAHPSEQEQAELFASILAAELRTMRLTATKAKRQLREQRMRSGLSDEPGERLRRLQERIAEADRLLTALNARFSTPL